MRPATRCVLTCLAILVVGCVERTNVADAPPATAVSTPETTLNLLGSYRLVLRELPDGSTLHPPKIFGFMTYTNTHRLFHFYDGSNPSAPMSFGSAAGYTISGQEYSETPEYEVANNETPGSGLVYTVAGSGFATPFTAEDGIIRFRDTDAGPVLVFTRDSLVATLEGAFVDRWVRVE